jgi:ribonucleoside-diphosphate reductase alpha chain
MLEQQKHIPQVDTLIQYIQKRDGSLVGFDRRRIEIAIQKACVATGKDVDGLFLSTITDSIIAELGSRCAGKAPHVEDIQDVVERTLAKAGLFEVAKAYILYRKEHAELRKQIILGQQKQAAQAETSFRHVQKRDGSFVDFDRTRIEVAIQKACIATGKDVNEDFLASITDQVIVELETGFAEKSLRVEDIQDVVERTLAKAGLFEVAKAYILYRKEHEDLRKQRTQETLKKLETRALHVKKRNGSLVPFDGRNIQQAISNVFRGHEQQIDVEQAVEEIVEECKHSLFEGISTGEINRSVILIMRAKIEQNPLYSDLTARFFVNDIYKNMLDTDEFEADFREAYEEAFPRKIREGVELGFLDPQLLEFDLQALSNHLKPERDRLLKYIGIETLYDRYFLRDRNRKVMELPQCFWMRVAMGIALPEKKREEKAIEFYDIISSLLYVPSTPTLFHSATHHPQLSSCYLTTVEDDLVHIFKCIGDNAQLSKWSGGLGTDWTNIRGTGALVKSTNVPSQGLIPFLKIADAATAAINRSGRRRGAACAYLETWHYDIEDFLELRKNTGDERRRTHEMNTANWIPDLFIKRVWADGQWTLFSPDETPDLHHLYGKAFEKRYEEYERKADAGEIKLYKRVKAKDLWRKVLTMLYETGHPWITFKDACNVRSPQDHVGVVHSSNLCTEITLNTSHEETAVCNLGSINLSRYIDGKSLDTELLQRTVKIAIRMLDNVIDINYYPTGEARVSNLAHRPIGLGIMGLQDALYQLDLRFDSEEAVKFSDEVMEFISYHAILASSELAREKGLYSSYQGSKWERGIFPLDTLALLAEERGQAIDVSRASQLDWEVVRTHVKAYGMRNSNCMAIAPTATISNIAGCLPSIEPIYKNLYVKSNQSGEFTIINEYLVDDLTRLGLWTKDMIEQLKYYDGDIEYITTMPTELKAKYKETFAIHPEWLLRHAAVRGKWIDQSQSLNIFLSTTSGKLLSDVYMSAWSKGLKTTYYLRSLGASSIEKSTLDIHKHSQQIVSSPEGHACVVGDPGCEACQ